MPYLMGNGRAPLCRHANCTGRFSILRVGLLLPAGYSVLSFAPIAVFETANGVSRELFYDIRLVSETGKVTNSLGRTTDTELLGKDSHDTLLLGASAEIVPPTPRTVAFLRNAPESTRRIAAICVGAFALGEAGLLDGRRATTHWAHARELQERFPKAKVEMDRIFIADGPIWTSAGMTAGIDLALGLVERDMGQDIARATARQMVVYHRRAGVSRSIPRCWSSTQNRTAFKPRSLTQDRTFVRN